MYHVKPYKGALPTMILPSVLLLSRIDIHPQLVVCASYQGPSCSICKSTLATRLLPGPSRGSGTCALLRSSSHSSYSASQRRTLQPSTALDVTHRVNSATTSPSYVHIHIVGRTSADFSPKSILSLIALFYFILASGPSRITRTLPWFIWGQLALDALMFIFWLSAAATSSYSCTDLCNACGIIDGYVSFDSESCECSTLFFKRDNSPRPVNVLQPRRSHSGGGSTDSTGGGSIAAKQAFDAIMT